MTTNTTLNRQGRWRHRAVALGVTVTLLGTLSACAPLVLGTAVGGAMVATDRRTSGALVEDKGINIKAITTSEIKISILIDGPYAELAVRTLHSCYGLDKN